MSRLLLLFTGISCASSPTPVITRVAPGFTARLNLPSASVAVPLLPPFSRTVAPLTGLPVSSRTLPVIFSVCARAGVTARPSSTAASSSHRGKAGNRQLWCFGWFIPFLFWLLFWLESTVIVKAPFCCKVFFGRLFDQHGPYHPYRHGVGMHDGVVILFECHFTTVDQFFFQGIELPHAGEVCQLV